MGGTPKIIFIIFLCFLTFLFSFVEFFHFFGLCRLKLSLIHVCKCVVHCGRKRSQNQSIRYIFEIKTVVHRKKHCYTLFQSEKFTKVERSMAVLSEKWSCYPTRLKNSILQKNIAVFLCKMVVRDDLGSLKFGSPFMFSFLDLNSTPVLHILPNSSWNSTTHKVLSITQQEFYQIFAWFLRVHHFQLSKP